MTAPRLLVVTAHPDDEVLHFGGLIHLTSLAGGAVTLLCATRGEVGEIADAALATPATLAAVRESELRTAAALLGVADLRLLDYRDSGDGRHTPTTTTRVPSCRLTPRQFRTRWSRSSAKSGRRSSRRGRPMGAMATRITSLANRHTAAAVARAAESGSPALGEPWDTPALYFAARPAGLRAEVRAAAAARNPYGGTTCAAGWSTAGRAAARQLHARRLQRAGGEEGRPRGPSYPDAARFLDRHAAARSGAAVYRHGVLLSRPPNMGPWTSPTTC